MSELISIRENNTNIRKHLLVTASALALTAYVATTTAANADDAGRPTVWMELGGQLERIDSPVDRFAPPFLASFEGLPFTSPVTLQKPPNYGVGAEAKVSFSPEGSDWVVSAAIRYGRSNKTKEVHQTPAPVAVTGTLFGQHMSLLPQSPGVFTTTQSKNTERHAVLDFQVGKDVGLGLWSHDASSVVSVGVRMAQFNSRSDVSMKGVPISVITPKKIRPKYHQSYSAMHDEARSFRGIGPTLSWNGFAPIAGNHDSAELTFDWGATVGVLFGRQKVSGEHEADGYYKCIGGLSFLGTAGCKKGVAADGFNFISTYHHEAPINRSRSVVSPNLGGFAGVSMRYSNARISMGYRGDFYFGALDGGIDAARRTTLGFYGPFATISLGLGG